MRVVGMVRVVVWCSEDGGGGEGGEGGEGGGGGGGGEGGGVVRVVGW